MRKSLLLIPICCSILIFQSLNATIIYVDSALTSDCLSSNYSIVNRNCSGNDGNAYVTPKDAANAAQAGDTIYVRQGTYTVINVSFPNSGQPGKPIVFAGFPGDKDRPVLQRGTNGPGSQSVFQFTTAGHSNFVFKYLVIRYANYGFLFGSPAGRISDIRIEDCEMYDFSGTAIRADYDGVERMLIQDCEVYRTFGTEGGFDFKVNISDYSPGAGSRLVVIRNVITHDNTQQQASGMIVQNSCEDFIYINNITYNNGEIGFASKAGGHNIFINNIAYDQGKASFYLRSPNKDFGSGNIIQGQSSDYLLLNNVGMGKKVLSGDQGPFRIWSSVNAFAYNNTLVSMREPGGAFFGAPFTVSAGADSMMIMYSKNNILYQAYDRYCVTLFDNLVNRTYQGDGNLFYVADKDSSGTICRFHGFSPGNVNFQDFRTYWNSDSASVYKNPLFVNFNRYNDTVFQNFNLDSLSPAIDKGLYYGVSNANDYPVKVEEFLASYNSFNDFSILSPLEKQELLSFIRNAYKYDILRNLRTNQPDIGAYEYQNSGQACAGFSASVSSVIQVDCSGDSTGAIDISITGGTPQYMYQWSHGVTTEDISGLPAGVYSVTVTDANNCKDVAGVTITQSSAIVLVTSSTPDNGTGNGTASALPSGGTSPYSYSWSSSTTGGGQTASMATGLSAGTYTVLVTDQNNCLSVETVTVNSTVGVNESNLQEEVQIYPNPSKGYITIIIPSSKDKADIKLVNTLGEYIAVPVHLIQHNQYGVDLAGYPEGIYMVKIRLENIMIVEKLMILRFD